MERTQKDQTLVLILRFVGGMLLFAFPAIFLPTSWMSGIHQWLGMGTFPDTPVVQYLTRSVAGMYVMHGGVMIMASQDVERYRPIVNYLGFINLGFGVAVTAIDFYADLPIYWSLVEGPGVVLIAILILVLNRLEDGETR